MRSAHIQEIWWQTNENVVLGPLGSWVECGDMLQSCRNQAECSSWAEVERFEHLSLGLCPNLSSLLLQLQHQQQRVCPGAAFNQMDRQRRFREGDAHTVLLACCNDGGTVGT